MGRHVLRTVSGADAEGDGDGDLVGLRADESTLAGEEESTSPFPAPCIPSERLVKRTEILPRSGR